jgi:hypothetical protein
MKRTQQSRQLELEAATKTALRLYRHDNRVLPSVERAEKIVLEIADGRPNTIGQHLDETYPTLLGVRRFVCRMLRELREERLAANLSAQEVKR